MPVSNRERIAELPFSHSPLPQRSASGHNKVSKSRSGNAGVARVEHQPARIRVAVLIEIAGAGDERQPRRSVWLGHTRRRRADGDGRHRIDKEELAASVGEDDDDVIAGPQHAKATEDHRLPWIARVAFDDRVTRGARPWAPGVPAGVPRIDR